MSRLGKCKNCGGELGLSPLIIYGRVNAFCKKCFKEYPCEMKAKSRVYTVIRE